MRRGRADVGSDAGSAVLLVAMVMASAALMALAVVELGVAAAQRSRAQTAADAAALAAASASVSDGHSAAARLARANGAALVSFRRSGWVVTVVVEVGEARATARATNGP